jgi:hypothetical protein
MNPRPSFLPYALLALGWVAFAAYVWYSARQLPERVAVHFGPSGLPDGWIMRGSYVETTLIFGAVVPAFVAGVFAFIRVGDGRLMNIPRREYWLAPERRAETLAFVQRQGAWFAGLLIAFLAAAHYFILMANGQSPATLSPQWPISCAGGLVAAMVLLVVSFVRYFYRKTA